MSSPNPSSSGGSTIGGIPVKYLLLGGGGILVAFLFLNKKSSGGSATSDVVTGANTYGETLGPHGALALGSLENQLLQQSGIIQEYAAGRIDSLETILGEQAAKLGSVGEAVEKNYNYQRAMQQAILGLYEPIIRNGGTTEESRRAWWEWLQGKFPEYQLGELPDYWESDGFTSVDTSNATIGG